MDHLLKKRYDPKLKIALGKYFLSTMTYRNLRTDLEWTIKKDWPGLNQTNFNLLKIRANGLKDQQKYVTKSGDEMSLKINMFYNRKMNKTIGLDDFGTPQTSSKAATSVFVFVVYPN